MLLKDESEENIKKSAEQLLIEDTFFLVLKGSAKGFKFSKYRFIILLIIFSIIFFGSSYYTMIDSVAVNKIVDRSNTIILSLLAIVVTGYAIFQAMASKQVIILLNSYNDRNSNESTFNTMQHTTFFIIINYSMAVLFNYILLIFLDVFFVNIIPYRVVYVCMVIYCTVMAYYIMEIKSFVYNIYQIFVISTTNQIIGLMKEKYKK